jgi:L-alanine-DL-glutamate epimerase-like enolase superfamily enzyme
MDADPRIVALRLRHPWGLSRGTAHELPTVLLRLGPAAAPLGLGEAAPVRYLHQSADRARALIAEICAGIGDADREDLAHHAARARDLAPEHSSARAAVDIALWDAAARRRGRSLRDHLHAERGPPLAPGARETSFTIALDSLDEMTARAREAARLPILKIKLGREPAFDREALRRVASAAPNARLRVDANGGWSPADARDMLGALADRGVEFVEQPLAHGQLDALAELRRTSPLPIYADEDIQGPESLPALRGRVDGINIKLMKCGGISPALEMIAAARREGWRVLLGCMIESRIGLAAAASLADRVDEADLDAHMLTQDDPVPPGSQSERTPAVPLLPGPGLGVALPTGPDLWGPWPP